MTSIFEGLFSSKKQGLLLQSKQEAPFWVPGWNARILDIGLDFNQILVPASSRTWKVERAQQAMLRFV